MRADYELHIYSGVDNFVLFTGFFYKTSMARAIEN
jgi:hypothetical protein